MKVLVALLVLWALPSVAAAQGTHVGGSVPSMIALTLDDAQGLSRLPSGPAERSLSIRVRVTSTAARTALSVADGDVADRHRQGRLTSAGSVLAQPLEARAGATAFLPLDVAIDPLLAVFRRPVANARVTVRLRQRIGPREHPRGTYSKTVLITVSPEAP